MQPRIFGGYEFDLPSFLRVMIEVSRRCSGSGWLLGLTAGHAFLISSFDERAQREAFGESGEFRAPSVAMPGLAPLSRHQRAPPAGVIHVKLSRV